MVWYVDRLQPFIEKKSMPPAVNLVGQKFNRWTVLSRNPKQHKESLWNCVCECGTESVLTASNLKGNRSKSCGCWRDERNSKDNSTHKRSKTQVYTTWQRIVQRCFNPKHPRYSDYGGRGITIYNAWVASFEEFYAYIGEPPTPDHSIDRYPDNDGNYEPENVRWASRKEQGRNKRNNRLYTYKGETKTLPEWAEITGIGLNTLYTRMYGLKKTIEQSIEAGPRAKRGPKLG